MSNPMSETAPEHPVQSVWSAMRGFVMPNGEPLWRHFDKGHDQIAFCHAVLASTRTPASPPAQAVETCSDCQTHDDTGENTRCADCPYLAPEAEVEALERAAKAHCDFFGGKGWWDTGLLADTQPKALEAMRLAIAALRGAGQ